MRQKRLFSSLILGTRKGPVAFRTWNLSSRFWAPQYSTPNRNRQADRRTVESNPRRQGSNDAIPNGLRASERAVKPHGTSMNRTSSAASDAPARITRSSRAASRGFFQNLRPSDGPRGPLPAALQTLPAAVESARDNDMPADAGTPCPARLPDTDAPPATPTNPALDRGKARYSTVPAGAQGRTTPHTPSEGRSAHGNAPGLAIATDCNHAQEGPRENLLPKVKSRGGVAYSAPGRF